MPQKACILLQTTNFYDLKLPMCSPILAFISLFCKYLVFICHPTRLYQREIFALFIKIPDSTLIMANLTALIALTHSMMILATRFQPVCPKLCWHSEYLLCLSTNSQSPNSYSLGFVTSSVLIYPLIPILHPTLSSPASVTKALTLCQHALIYK